jgi:DNA-binding transcriptional ArsR family regulator
MSEPAPPQIVTTTVRTIEADSVFEALSDPSRRRILVALFDGQWHAVSGMGGPYPKHRDLIRKHCDALVKGGFIESQPDPADERRKVYRLTPIVKPATTPESRTMDFGCCIIRC